MSFLIRNPSNGKDILAVIDLLSLSFPNLNREYLIKRILGDSCYNKNNTYILTDTAKILSHVHLFNKKIWWERKKIIIAGLGFICTLPEYRKKGYASRIIRKIVKEKRNSLLILFTKISKYYEKFGFSVVSRKFFSIKKDAWKHAPNKGIKIRRFRFYEDIKSVIKIHKSFFRFFVGIVDRNQQDWYSQMSYFNEDKNYFLVLEVNGMIKAYIRCKRFKDSVAKNTLRIVEYASLDRDKKFIADFIAYIFQAGDISQILGDSIFLDDSLAKIFQIKEYIDSSMMWRCNKKIKLTEKIKSRVGFLETDAF